MKRWSVLVLLSILALVVQASLLGSMQVYGVRPDLVLIIVVFESQFGGARSGAAAGTVLGLLEDIMAGGYLGLGTLAKGLTGYFLGLGANRFYKDNYLLPVLAVFLGTFVHEALYLGTRLAAGGGGPSSLSSFGQAVLTLALYNSAIALVVYGRFYASYGRGSLKFPQRPVRGDDNFGFPG